MALHGITMPLIAMGREVVFRRLFAELGMTGAPRSIFIMSPRDLKPVCMVLVDHRDRFRLSTVISLLWWSLFHVFPRSL